MRLRNTSLPRTRSPLVSCWQECGRRGIRVVWQLLLAPELSCSAPARLGGEAIPVAAKARTVTRTHTPVPPVCFQRTGEENRIRREHFSFSGSGLGSEPPPPVVDSPKWLLRGLRRPLNISPEAGRCATAVLGVAGLTQTRSAPSLCGLHFPDRPGLSLNLRPQGSGLPHPVTVGRLLLETYSVRSLFWEF